ncbi:hypothetical protein N0V90_003196 [Kalmusia sp. IMI 367209]|nr:hypothetical protein N0V90_003196 [Kalmusia sp. IMI 367209]
MASPSSAYPSPLGTISLDMTGIVDLGIPPVPPLSYWEPDTPSPVSPHNPFLSPPAAGPGSFYPAASPLLPASPLSIFDRRGSSTSSSFSFLRSSSVIGLELSPRFLNPRTPPLPPMKKSPIAKIQKMRIHSTMCPVPQTDLESIKNEDLYDMLLAVREQVLEEMEGKKERELMGGDRSLVDLFSRGRKKRQRLDMVKKESFTVKKRIAVKG